MTGYALVFSGVPRVDRVGLGLDDELAGSLKFVLKFTGVDPEAASTPIAGPTVDPRGITDPTNGIKVPFCIVPPIEIIDPAGVNEAIVPFGTTDPMRVTGDMSDIPTVPVTGFAAVAFGIPRVDGVGLKFVGTVVIAPPAVKTPPVCGPTTDPTGIV